MRWQGRRRAAFGTGAVLGVLLGIGGVVAVQSLTDGATTSPSAAAHPPSAAPRSSSSPSLPPASTPAASPPGPAPSGSPAPLPRGTAVACPSPTHRVSTAQQLTDALRTAQPGDSIQLADGTYEGAFVATTSGTPDAPIWLCGSPAAVIEGRGTDAGYGLHLAPADYWRVVGFTVRNAQKGVVADGTRGSVVQGLTVEEIGDEGIHLRAFSTGNAVLDNTVRRTGLHRDKFGEGIYIGSAVSNWPDYSGGKPDRSDHNLVQGNTISQTGAESIDVKEGTTGGVLRDNVFDGTGMTGGDSWVDVKGNDWLIEGNRGTHPPHDGFQTHEIEKGWGTRNTFRDNVIDGVQPPGLGIHLAPVLDNVVSCDNRTGSGDPATSTPTSASSCAG